MARLLLVLISVAVAGVAIICNEVPEVPKVLQMVVTTKDVDVDEVVVNGQSAYIVTKSNLSEGTIGSKDKLMAKSEHIKKPATTVVHIQDITIRGNSSTKITAIRVTEVGETQNGCPSIKEGGVGKNFVVIRLQSARGRGYHYKTEVWGKEAD